MISYIIKRSVELLILDMGKKSSIMGNVGAKNIGSPYKIKLKAVNNLEKIWR